jgi:altronate dehydratase large subunit
MRGFARKDKRKGVRNHLVVVFLVECARYVAEEIVEDFRHHSVQLIGFPSCYPSVYGEHMLGALCTHPNVGAALLISLGCESFGAAALEANIIASGRPSRTLVIQRNGGTRSTIAAGKSWVETALRELRAAFSVPMTTDELTVGILPDRAGADASRALGRLSECLLAAGATIILKDPANGRDLVTRGATPAISSEIAAMAHRASQYRSLLHEDVGAADFSHYAAGYGEISGLLRPGLRAGAHGLYLLDDVPAGEPRYGPLDVGPAVSAAELAACGAQILVAAADDGALMGTAVVPLVRLRGDPGIAKSAAGEVDAADERSAFVAVTRAAEGRASAAERLGYCDFALVHKSFEPPSASR